MYKEPRKQNSGFDPNLFAQSLGVYEDFAEGLIRLFSRITGFITSLVNERAHRPM